MDDMDEVDIDIDSVSNKKTKHNIYIDGFNKNEVSVAVLDMNNRLKYYDYENIFNKSEKNNIYIGYIEDIEPSLQSVFVRYDNDSKNGLLPLNKIYYQYFNESIKINTNEDINFNADGTIYTEYDNKKYSIQDLVYKGQRVVVQILRDARQGKGPLLTTYLSIKGMYCVLLPNHHLNQHPYSINHHIKELMKNIILPDQYQIIAIDDAVVKDEKNDLCVKRDMRYLVRTWKKIINLINDHQDDGCCCIYRDNDIIKNTLINFCNKNLENILVEGEDACKYTSAIIDSISPLSKKKFIAYDDDEPLFIRYKINQKINDVISNRINLKSGGYVIISHTEAMTTIDINSGGSTKGSNIANTAMKTNLEAAEEICRQLEIRNIGGIIIIDFIDMDNAKKRQILENTLHKYFKNSTTKIKIGKIYFSGLLTIFRQRIGFSIHEKTNQICIKCLGSGFNTSISMNISKFLLKLRQVARSKQGIIIASMIPYMYEKIANYYMEDINNLQKSRLEPIYMQIMDEKSANNKHFIINVIPPK